MQYHIYSQFRRLGTLSYTFGGGRWLDAPNHHGSKKQSCRRDKVSNILRSELATTFPWRRKDTWMSPVLAAVMPSSREVEALAPVLFTGRSHTDGKGHFDTQPRCRCTNLVHYPAKLPVRTVHIRLYVYMIRQSSAMFRQSRMHTRFALLLSSSHIPLFPMPGLTILSFPGIFTRKKESGKARQGSSDYGSHSKRTKNRKRKTALRCRCGVVVHATCGLPTLHRCIVPDLPYLSTYDLSDLKQSHSL